MKDSIERYRKIQKGAFYMPLTKQNEASKLSYQLVYSVFI